MRSLDIVRSRFADRIDAPYWWTFVASRMPRVALAVLLAAIAPALLIVSVILGPAEFGKAATHTQNVHETFARFVGAVATASAIAVSIAQLSLGRELKGIGSQEERHKANREYRERVRKASGRASAPLSLGAFLALAVESLGESARRARASATNAELASSIGDVELREFLETMETVAARSRAALLATSRDPQLLAAAVMDFEEEITSQLARRFAREDHFAPRLRNDLAEISERLHDVILGSKYAKTLGMQYGMSRMATSIVLATIPSLAVAAGMSLTYGDGAIAALGVTGATALVATAAFLVLFPLGLFVSYVLRFVFLNEHSLPTDAFVLGPEEVDVHRAETSGRASATGTRRSA